MMGMGRTVGCCPFLEIYQVKGLENDLIYDNKDDKQVKFFARENGQLEIKLNQKLHLYGNILIKFKHSGSTGNYDMFRVSFNTGFIPALNEIICNRLMISPEDLHKDFNKIPIDFSVSFKFTDFCKDRKDSEGNDI